MSVLLLIYLILLIISFNILYKDGGYRRLYVKACNKNKIVFVLVALVSTLISPYWLLLGVVDALTRK